MRNIVDRPARDTAAQLLRNFVSGKVSNDAFEDAQPTTHDLAIDAIWDTAWVFYDDSKEHRLIGKYRLPPDQRRACVRWILFLYSDHLYEWPTIYLPGIDPASRTQRNFLKRLFSMHQHLNEDQVMNFMSTGHYPVWPFLRVADYKKALAQPRLLSASAKPNLS
ncbi:MAG: hypothetical protein ABJF50_09115 [Paracoccaceae bacterium]|uniref:hypothetical protein n=1 Tax=Yoonia sp. TaxID=2212373 RepID=UPI00327757A8